MRMFAIASLATLAMGSTALPALAAAGSLGHATGAGLAAHRAVYDLTLNEASERSGITGLVGRMVYDFAGSACEGYTVNYRFVTEISTGDDAHVTDMQFTAFEDIRNPTFQFVLRTFVDQALEREVRGSAEAAGDVLAIKLEKPEALALDITPALFPTRHMIEMIEKARNGERIYESRIYDGSNDGDESMITTTILGAKETADSTDTEAPMAGELADEAYWPGSISYFDEAAQGDALPVYAVTFKLYENGVTRDMIMDYGDYVINGRLAQLDLYEAEPCPE